MAEYDYDLFVIGGGSAGVRAARMSATYGARVALAEERYLGGTCVNVGCIPKKLFVYASHFTDNFVDAINFGWTVGAREFDWRTLITNKDAEIKRLNGIYDRLLQGAGVEVFEERATLVDSHSVAIGPRHVTAETILVATGGWPSVPAVPGAEHAITSNEVFHLDALPPRVIIVGGGYIAVEFAGIFSGMGAEVTQLYRGELFMRGFDHDARAHLVQEMVKAGVDLRFNADVAGIEKTSAGLVATLKSGQPLETDCVLFATGRSPNTGGLGLEAAGVAMNGNGAVIVDAAFRSSVPSIYAIGDVIDRVQLTPVAIAEAMIVARALYAGGSGTIDYPLAPSAVFSQPTLATVGLTEEAARERFAEVMVYKSAFRPLKHTISGRDEETLMKLIVDTASDRVVGVHMVGPEAGEIMQGIAVALTAGATKAMFDATIGIHPTVAEEFVSMREPVQAEPAGSGAVAMPSDSQRAPFQVLVLPYYVASAEAPPQYAVFRRSDWMDTCWQGIAGGGQSGETAEQAARREAREEAGTEHCLNLLALDSMATIPVVNVRGFLWGPDVLVIPEYAFGMQTGAEEFVLSSEHVEFRWLSYQDASRLLTWDSNKNALWELNHRIERGRLLGGD